MRQTSTTNALITVGSSLKTWFHVQLLHTIFCMQHAAIIAAFLMYRKVLDYELSHVGRCELTVTDGEEKR